MIAVLILTASVFSKNYYIRQMLIADFNGTGKLDTSYQETYISDDMIVILDEMSKIFIDDDSYEFYNMIDSSFYKRTSKEREQILNSTDSLMQKFELTKTDDKLKIGPWQAEKYIGKAQVMGMEMIIDMFISKDTGFPADIMMRQQNKMYQNSKKINEMMDKIKATGGIVVKEIAKIGGTVVSEKQITAMKNLEKIDAKYTQRPKGFKEMKQ